MISPEELKYATDFIISTLKDLRMSKYTIRVYSLHYQELHNYVKDKALVEVDDSTLLDFLRLHFNIQISSLYTTCVGAVAGKHIKPFSVLSWYLATGIVDFRARMRNPPYECPAGFIDSYENYIHHMKMKKLAPCTVKRNSIIVQQLIRHLTENCTETANMISSSDILSFLPQFQHIPVNSFGSILCGVRSYLRYLAEEGVLEEDISSILPHLRIPRKSGIPHAWSKEELRALLSAVDRASPTGKRNYAILLLTIQTGFRAADIRRLKLTDIDWTRHKIHIMTGKNKQDLELPLLESTGWAIIDYLRNGRPQTDCDCVFVRHMPPYRSLGSTSGLDYALDQYMMKAGIKIAKGERHGMHTLRSSFAKNMLDAGAPLPVISQALSHRDINSTAFYLKIDIEGLRQCALDPNGWEAAR